MMVQWLGCWFKKKIFFYNKFEVFRFMIFFKNNYENIFQRSSNCLANQISKPKNVTLPQVSSALHTHEGQSSKMFLPQPLYVLV